MARRTIRQSRIYIAGHTGRLGSALVRHLEETKNIELVTYTHAELDLLDQRAVLQQLKHDRPGTVIIAAGRLATADIINDYPAQFLYENLTLYSNLIHGAWACGARNLICPLTTLIYPVDAPDPLHPDFLETGATDPDFAPVIQAQLTALRLCLWYRQQYNRQYVPVIMPQLYDDREADRLHNASIPGMLERLFRYAREEGLQEIEIPGTGEEKVSLLHADKAAEMLLHVLDEKDEQIVQLPGEPASDLASLIRTQAEQNGFQGEIRF
ncbi:NAD-dependent epimerase/dehydratase family protein, partial [candidate division KSB1 bacterium]|nr:NAD-dependent epimerase/dehydratase family protein [candidate division KSB1 bacterium]